MKKTNKVIKFEDLPEDALEALEENYPDGWQQQVRKITKPDGSFFHAFNLDAESISYLVKVDIEIDLAQDLDEEMDDLLIDKKAEKEAEHHSKLELSNDEEKDEDEES